MFITSIVNVIYLFGHTASSSNHEYVKTSSNSIKQEILSNNQTGISDNTYDIFHEMYQKFSNSFVNNYISMLNKTNQSSMYCPPVPPDLQGPIIIKELPQNFSLLNYSLDHSEVLLGGRYHPKTCVARHKVAIIVPYRDRWEILEKFLYHTHTFLQRQQLDYRIYVCEQAFTKTFNKGIVMNGCFKEILKLEPNTSCFIMHDVDLLLIDDRNMYTCPIVPRHLSVAVDKFQFYLPYTQLVGGVLGM